MFPSEPVGRVPPLVDCALFPFWKGIIMEFVEFFTELYMDVIGWFEGHISIFEFGIEA
jgi:hypothetical protein